MTTILQILLVVMLTTDLALSANSRLGTCINIVSIQGFALGLLPAAIGLEIGMSADLILISGIGIVLRGILFPHLLQKSIRGTNIRREAKPLVGYFGSTLIILMLFAMSLWLSSRMSFIGQEALLISTVALTTIFAGTFLIVARRLAVMQIIGYILLENGIYCIGLTLVRQIPLLVELGVLFDAIVAVFVMSVATNKIHDEFEHLDVQRLDTLKG
jgi:hydrogenase-4 component E